jgi:hypothetical protein
MSWPDAGKFSPLDRKSWPELAEYSSYDRAPHAAVGDRLLLEDGSFILLENGFKIKLETA